MDCEIIILKIGGSSITDKSCEETLDQTSLDWFASLVAKAVDPSFLSGVSDTHKDCSGSAVVREPKPSRQFVVVHGAGSFGHHSAKRYGLRCGKAAFLEECSDPAKRQEKRQKLDTSSCDESPPAEERERRHQMEGLAKTRRSVLKLNAATVGALIDHGVNAVGISPGVSFHYLRAHGATGLPKGMAPEEYENDDSPKGMMDVCRSVKQALRAGLVPVVHGDACLLHDHQRGGILGGDTIVEGLATLWNADSVDGEGTGKLSQVIFITDVGGVYTSDPKADKSAKLIRSIKVDRATGGLSIESKAGDDDNGDALDVDASGSSHAHDVTGGLAAKLGAAVAIVQSGIDVVISQCGSDSTEKYVRGDYESIWDVEAGTLLSQRIAK